MQATHSYDLFSALFFLYLRGICIIGLELIGAVAAVLVPLPFIFYFLGKKIRARSTFAPAPDIAQDKRRDEESAGESVGENGQVDEKKAEDS